MLDYVLLYSPVTDRISGDDEMAAQALVLDRLRSEEVRQSLRSGERRSSAALIVLQRLRDRLLLADKLQQLL